VIHERGAALPVSDQTIRELHRLSRREIGDAGRYRETDADIIEKYSDGRASNRSQPARSRPRWRD
jgi:hypothetical protein